MQRKKDEKNTEDLKRVITEVANTVSFTSLKMDYSFQIVWLYLNHEWYTDKEIILESKLVLYIFYI